MTPDPAAVPDGWQVVRLGDVAEVVGGTTPSRSNELYWGGEVPWVVPSELTGLKGRYLDASREFITKQGLKASRLRVLPAGSVLLTSRATIGATAINALPVTTNQGFQNLVGMAGVDGLWLYYSVSAMRYELEKRGAGSTFREVSRDAVRSLPILFPPLAEQCAIAAVLNAIDEAIERTEEVIAATERLRDALLYELLTRGLPGRHSKWVNVPGLVTVPACWAVVRLQEIAEVVGGSTPPRGVPDYWGGDVPWVVPSGLTQLSGRDLDGSRESITHEGVRAAGLRLIPPGSVLLTTRATIGVTAINRVPVTTNQGFQNLVPHDGTDSLWLYYLIAAMRRELEKRGAGSTFLEVSRDSVRSLRVPFPSLEEQQAIAAVLDGVDGTIERAREERARLHSLRASTADALLTGRVRVTV